VAALHAANRAGYPPANFGLWGQVHDLFDRTRLPSGGWRYCETDPETKDKPPTHTMTASGCLCLVLAAQAMPPANPEADPVLAAGLDWLARNFQLDGPNSFYNLDVLAALGRARAGKTIGAGALAHDWFKEGSESFLWAQRDDGRFVGTGAEANPVIATAFALRFLASRPAGPPAEAPKTPIGEPELLTLLSLPGGQNKSGPWLSADGRTLYWADKQGSDHRIWRANRKGPGEPFEGGEQLFTGHDLTLSADMTEVILVDHEGPPAENRFALFASRKPRPTGPAFGSWRKLTELADYGFVAAPCLSADGLTLYAEQFGDKSLPPNVRFRRAGRDAPWGKAEAVPIRGLEKGSLRFPFLSPDGRYLFGNNDVSPSGMVMLTSTDEGKSFGSPRAIEVPGAAVKGKFPRYAPDSNELFFGESTTGPVAELYLIRNFDPDRDTRPVK
jgi:hypothetical protein